MAPGAAPTQLPRPAPSRSPNRRSAKSMVRLYQKKVRLLCRRHHHRHQPSLPPPSMAAAHPPIRRTTTVTAPTATHPTAVAPVPVRRHPTAALPIPALRPLPAHTGQANQPVQLVGVRRPANCPCRPLALKPVANPLPDQQPPPQETLPGAA